MSITTIMSVAGDRKYFDFAAYSIPSFVRCCPSHRLVVFTDDRPLLYQRCPSLRKMSLVDVLDLSVPLCCVDDAARVQNNTSAQYHRLQNHDRIHYHFAVSVLPILSTQLGGDFTLKVDADMFFVGDFMRSVTDAMMPGSHTGVDFWLVERTHPLMKRIGRDLPGVGFALWRNNGHFVRQYVQRFDDNEQATMQKIFFNAVAPLKTQIITNPALHLVYPFWQGVICGRAFTKIDAEQIRADGGMAIHCGGAGVEQQLDVLKRWYE